ncbi:hypothetical protein QJ495_00005, partial [Klebsiella pneumoniae]|nr:hypothetical protein [Klebsiella pneumoniae]
KKSLRQFTLMATATVTLLLGSVPLYAQTADGCLQQALMTHHNFLRNFPSSGISVNGFRLTMRPLYQENHAELLPFVC